MGNVVRINPFKPTAGMNPPELIGRDLILDDFAEALDNGPGAPERLMRISGVRGVGKTVLLNALGDVARQRGFKVVDVAASPGFCNRILTALRSQKKIDSLTLAPSVLGVSLGSVELSNPEETLGAALFEASRDGGLLVTLDEIQDAPIDEMRELGNEIQLLIRQGANVAFAFAGLPASVDGVVTAEALTFLQRAQHIELSRLPDLEVGTSIEETMSRAGRPVDPGVSMRLMNAAAGYPFMIQLVGYYTWQVSARRNPAGGTISMEDAEQGISAARQRFESMVLLPALGRLSEMQVEYLKALAACGEGSVSSGDVAKRMERSSADVAAYRKRLIDAGLIESPKYGKVAFAIPYMREYLMSEVE